MMLIGVGKDVKRMSYNFLGESKHTLENGCRLIIPLRFRSALQPEFVLFKAPEGCLFMYDTESFKELMAYLRADAHTMEGRARSRVFMKAAKTIIPDKQGRFTIPADYLEHASIRDTVYLLGNDNKIEIWSEEDYVGMGGDEPLTPDMYPQIPY